MTHLSRDIFIVDDEIGIRELLSEILQDEGFQVIACENAAEAKALRLQKQPALVLLDIWMPGMDGLSLLKEWVQDGLLSMPVIMMSGHATIDLAVEAIQLGAVDVLEKPIGLQKLLQAIKTALHNAKKVDPKLNVLKSWPIGSLYQSMVQLEKAPYTILLLEGPEHAPYEWFAKLLHRTQGPFLVCQKSSELRQMDFSEHKQSSIFVATWDEELIQFLSNIMHVLQHHRIKILVHCLQKPEKTPEGWGVLVLPALKDHMDQLPALIQFAKKHWISAQTSVLDDEAINLKMLKKHPWHGNFNELIAYLSTGQLDQGPHMQECLLDFSQDLKSFREDMERRYLEHHIQRQRGSVIEVAKQSGLERTHLYRKLKQLGIKV